jgi:hypothetical protein
MDDQYSHIYLPKGLCSYSNAILLKYIYRYCKCIHIHNKEIYKNKDNVILTCFGLRIWILHLTYFMFNFNH